MKKTALAMMEGCESGVRVLRAEELLSSIDTEFHRSSVQAAAEFVVSCATCQGNPEVMEGDFACPLTQDPATEVVIRSALDSQNELEIY